MNVKSRDLRLVEVFKEMLIQFVYNQHNLLTFARFVLLTPLALVACTVCFLQVNSILPTFFIVIAYLAGSVFYATIIVCQTQEEFIRGLSCRFCAHIH